MLTIFCTCSIKLSQIAHDKGAESVAELMVTLTFGWLTSFYFSVAFWFFNSPFAYTQNATTPGHMSLFTVDIFNMWKPSLVFSLFFHACAVSKKNSPSVWTSENKWLYFGKPRNLWTYLSKQSLVQCRPTVASQWFLHHPPRSLQ